MSMSRRTLIRHAGLAALEAVGIITVAFAVFTGALGLTDYLNRVDAAVTALDREVRNGRSSTFGISQRASDGMLLLSLQTTALDTFIEQAAERIKLNRSEFAYAIADIDPRTGELLGIRPPARKISGGLGAPQRSQECPGVESELAIFSQRASNRAVPSALAIPQHGGGGAAATDLRFLTQTVVIVGRGEVDFSDASLTGIALRAFGSSSRVPVCTVTLARADVTLS